MHLLCLRGMSPSSYAALPGQAALQNEGITSPQCEISERETDGPRDHVLISNKKGTVWAATLPSITEYSST